MKLVLISDTHSKHRYVNVPDGDILIHSGDFSNIGNPYEVADFLDWFSSHPHQYKIFIAGNHDLSFERKKTQAVNSLLFDLDLNIFYLQDSEVTIDGVKFYGTPWQPEFNDWAFNLPRGEKLIEKWNKIPLDTNVLITHGPAFGYLDYSIYSRTPVGCEDLLNRIKEVKPQIHICGHIHDGYGVKYDKYTTYFNASICDESYKPTNTPWVVHIDEDSKKIKDYYQHI